jgi:predicted PurR-regulated permease PerM
MPGTTHQERFGQIFYYGFILLLLYLLFRIFQPFLVPLAWAGVLVVCFYPVHARLEKRFGATRGALASTIAVTLLLIVPVVFILSAFVREGLEAIRNFQDTRGGASSWLESAQRVWQWVQARLPFRVELDVPTLLREAFEKVGGFLAAQAGAAAKNVAVFLFDLVIVIFSMFFFFRDAGAIDAKLRSLIPFEPQQKDELLAQGRDLIYASVTSSLLIAAVQGLLGGIAFAALGFGAPVFWGVMMGFFSLLPMGGSAIIWIPAALFLFATGETVRGVILIAVGAGVVGSVDNVLRPILLSGKTPLNSLLIFVSVLGGIGVFGMLGIILGPIVVASAVSLFKLYIHREPPAEAPPAPVN